MEDREQPQRCNFRVPEKGIATIGIWVGIGLGCYAAPEHAGDIVTAGSIATVLMWLFG